MRRLLPPLRVTLPPPSSTTRELVFTTFAVAVIVIVTGLLPQLNRMIPPLATAATTALDVQLAAVPVPTIRSALRVSTARASAGTVALPAGLPKTGAEAAVDLTFGAVLDVVAGGTVAVTPPPAAAAGSALPPLVGSGCAAEAGAGPFPQPARAAATETDTATRIPERFRTRAPNHDPASPLASSGRA